MRVYSRYYYHNYGIVTYFAEDVSHFIRTSADQNAQNKPTSFIVRQFGILTLKVYMVQMLLHLIQTCSTTSIQNNLKSAIRTLLYSIANEYNTQQEFDNYYQEIMKLASQNAQYRSDIYNISKNVEAAKTNVEKAVVNDQRAISLVSQSRLS